MENELNIYAKLTIPFLGTIYAKGVLRMKYQDHVEYKCGGGKTIVIGGSSSLKI